MDLREQLQQHLGTAYTIERELGGGGMSRVFVANEERLGRKVVVKVLSPDLAQGLNAERFEREIRLAASLQHANIVPLLAAGDMNGIPWFTMPFVDGESLRGRVAHGAIPISEVVSILRDVTRALAYAHARGIVHRDIKPDNILLAGGAATVTDFGIAKAVSASRTGAPGATLTQLGTSLGTPAYMAPEQVAGDPHLDHRVDLYALGCTAFELLTGQQPYGNRTAQQALAAHLTEAVPEAGVLRTDTPPALAALVAQLMAKHPDDRPQSATQVLQQLDSIATVSTPTMAFAAPGMLRKALMAWAAATVVVLIAARAAVAAIGLPDWVFPGAVIVMGLGLPALLVTAYVQHVTRRVATATPTLTPGGTTVPKAPSGTIATMALKASPHLTWRRARRGGVIAVGAFILLVGLAMASRAAGIGPWASLMAAGKLGANSRIILADLIDSPGDSALAPIVVEAVRAGLAQSAAAHVVTQSDVADALQEMKRPRSTRLNDPAVVREVAARTNAQAILGGRLAQVGSGYVISLNLTATSGGAVLASFQGTADGTSDLLQVVDRMTRKLRGQIGESLRSVQHSVPLERATTSSLDALRLYSEATVANDVDAKYARAVQLLRQTVGLDSTFALAWRKLGIALSNGGAPQAVVDSAFGNAMRYADRLPQPERDLVEAAYYGSGAQSADRGKALAAYQRVFAFDSTNLIAINDLGILYGRRLQFDSAAHYYRIQLRLKPNFTNAMRLFGTMISAGQVDSAAALRDSLARAEPPGSEHAAALLRARAGIFTARGQWDSVLPVAEALRRLAAGDPNRPDGSGIATGVALYQGRFAHAIAVDSEAADRGAAREIATNPEVPGLFRAQIAIQFLGQKAEAVRLLDRAVASRQWAAMAPVDRPYILVAVLYAQAGQPAKGRVLVDRSIATDPAATSPDAQSGLAYARGEIALAEAKYPDAIREFRAAARGPDGAPATSPALIDNDLARAFDQAGQADSALAYLQHYLAVPAAARPDAVYLAGVEKRLGELFDARNQRDSALTHYGAFVDQWKHADPEVQPSVASVRRRMAELVAEEGQ
jgi:tRNA A-37 threonylcarbamoyl transferase component Bud32/tetratricopeptide (TPR) repeat protein